jgi:hypothetical protein
VPLPQLFIVNRAQVVDHESKPATTAMYCARKHSTRQHALWVCPVGVALFRWTLCNASSRVGLHLIHTHCHIMMKVNDVMKVNDIPASLHCDEGQ